MILYNKQGLSEVVTTLLLIALTIAIFAVVAGFIIPFVQKSLNHGQSCFDVMGKIAVKADGTCFNTSSRETYVNIGTEDVDLQGIIVSLRGEGTSSSFKIQNGSGNVLMLFNRNAPVELPGKNEERTYIFNTSFVPTEVAIAPLMSESCQESQKVQIEAC